MVKRISNIWTYISEIGVSNEYSFGENVKIKLLNQMIFLGWISEIFLVALAPLSSQPIEYIGRISVFIIIQGIILALHYFKLIRFARYFNSFIGPVGVAIMMLYTQEHFGEGYLFVLCIFLTYIMYDDHLRIRNIIVVANVLLYLSTAIYLYYNSGPATEVSTGFDEHIVFLMCIFGMGMVILLYQRELNKNQSRQGDLINQLREKNDELSDTNSELERFTYIASHDLKSPLRTIINFLEVMERSIKKQDYRSLLNKLQHVKTGAQQMNYVVSDILEYSAINNTPLEKSYTDLNDILEKVKISLQIEIQEKDVFIEQGRLPAILANDIEFITLFQNLIENGIKYNLNENPIVQVHAEYMEEFFILKFKDNGIGIESKYHDRIFELFQRLHTQSDFEGTGLGLGICAKIIKSYGGDIWVESMPNQGSVFIVQLPIDMILPYESSPSQVEIAEHIMMD